MRPLNFFRGWLLRHFRGRRGFGDGRAVSSGGAGQLYAQGWERQGLSTGVVGHFDDVLGRSWMKVRCRRCQRFFRILFAAVVM